MYGDRKTWKALLPVIQAFAEGKAIQRRDYDGRWQDADEMNSMLSESRPFRVRPENWTAAQKGRWSRRFKDVKRDLVEEGTVIFDNRHEDDTVDWPKHSYIERAKFTSE